MIRSLAALLLAAACAAHAQPAKEDAARELVRESLRDPFSAQFRRLQVSPAGNVVCGQVNAKNAMGGYVGWTPFVVVLETRNVILRDTSSGAAGDAMRGHFDKLHRQICIL